MTAKEKQKEFINTYLKSHGYKTGGKMWWKNMGEFFKKNK